MSQTKEQREVAERNQAIIDSAVSKAKELGQSSHSGIGEAVKVTDAQLADTGAFRASGRPSLCPAHTQIDKKSGIVTRFLFTQADFDAIMQGVYCARCWELQLHPALPEWTVQTSPQLCESVTHRSCGFPRGRQWIDRLPHEIGPLPPAR